MSEKYNPGGSDNLGGGEQKDQEIDRSELVEGEPSAPKQAEETRKIERQKFSSEDGKAKLGETVIASMLAISALGNFGSIIKASYTENDMNRAQDTIAKAAVSRELPDLLRDMKSKAQSISPEQANDFVEKMLTPDRQIEIVPAASTSQAHAPEGPVSPVGSHEIANDKPKDVETALNSPQVLLLADIEFTGRFEVETLKAVGPDGHEFYGPVDGDFSTARMRDSILTVEGDRLVFSGKSEDGRVTRVLIDSNEFIHPMMFPEDGKRSLLIDGEQLKTATNPHRGAEKGGESVQQAIEILNEHLQDRVVVADMVRGDSESDMTGKGDTQKITEESTSVKIADTTRGDGVYVHTEPGVDIS